MAGWAWRVTRFDKEAGADRALGRFDTKQEAQNFAQPLVGYRDLKVTRFLAWDKNRKLGEGL